MGAYLRRLAAAGLLVMLGTPLGATGMLDKPITTGKLNQDLFAQAILSYSNAVRAASGQPPLKLDPALRRAATEHALNMARLKTHAHVLPVRGEASLSERIKGQSVHFQQAAENIAMNKVYRLLGRPISIKSEGCAFTYSDTRQPVPVHTYKSLAKEAVDRWLSSPRHRASLLSPTYHRLGAGVGLDTSGPACGDLYLVQDFAD